MLTERRTQLGRDPVAVHTVEHVLAAVSGLAFDDIEVALDAAERTEVRANPGRRRFRAVRRKPWLVE